MYVFFFCAHPHLLSCKALAAAVPVLGCFPPCRVLSLFLVIVCHHDAGFFFWLSFAIMTPFWVFWRSCPLFCFLVVVCHHDTILFFCLGCLFPFCFFLVVVCHHDTIIISFCLSFAIMTPFCFVLFCFFSGRHLPPRRHLPGHTHTHPLSRSLYHFLYI